MGVVRAFCVVAVLGRVPCCELAGGAWGALLLYSICWHAMCALPHPTPRHSKPKPPPG